MPSEQVGAVNVGCGRLCGYEGQGSQGSGCYREGGGPGVLCGMGRSGGSLSLLLLMEPPPAMANNSWVWDHGLTRSFRGSKFKSIGPTVKYCTKRRLWHLRRGPTVSPGPSEDPSSPSEYCTIRDAGLFVARVWLSRRLCGWKGRWWNQEGHSRALVVVAHTVAGTAVSVIQRGSLLRMNFLTFCCTTEGRFSSFGLNFLTLGQTSKKGILVEPQANMGDRRVLERLN
jgi:hypothetical protein